jgi:hypothetical protein
VNPAARKAGNQRYFFASGSGGEIDVTVVNFEALEKWSASTSAPPDVRNKGMTDLVLFLDGQAVTGLYPQEVVRPPGTRVVKLRGENVNVSERVLRFVFDRAPVNTAWPQGMNHPEPKRWDRVSMTVSVGFAGGNGVRSQSFDPNVEAAVKLEMLPRWHPSEVVPEYAYSLDSWVGGFVYDGKEQFETQFTHGLGDNITLALINADAYVQWAQSKDQNQASARTIANLVLFIDGRQIPGLHPTLSREPSEDFIQGRRGGQMIVPIHWLQFNLARTVESNAAWGALLNRPTLYRDVAVSVGFEDLAPVLTAIGTNAPAMRLIVIPMNRWSATGALLIVLSLGVFLVLAAKSNLIRDPGLPAKPDGLKPFSLARTQMAFWFFLVFSTYFFIFVITGDKDTIPASILGLISVSAATAVGTALVDAAARKDVPAAEAEPSQPITNRQEEIKRLNNERKAIDDVLKDLTGDELQSKMNQRQHIESRIGYLRQSRWQNFLYDLLAENGTVSFHQFQICMWTLMLGIIFIKEVWDGLAMPEFSATLVGLMGISSGTYVALKERPAAKS